MGTLKLTPAQQEKVARTCETVIGMRLNVNVDKKSFITGIVESAKPAYWGAKALVFEVVLICGTNQKRNTVYISTFNSIR